MEPTSSDGSARAILAGKVLAGRFRILRLIGAGGMGEVFEAEDVELREKVAIKTVRLELLQDAHSLERFKREVLLAKKVTHPNVCRIYDLFRHSEAHRAGEDIVFLSMELLRGETLADLLERNGPMTPEQALPIVLQAASGLGAAHAANVLHRDFKPGNVILVPQTAGEVRAVVTDFGLATRAASNLSLTLSGTTNPNIAGTPAYMSPEQVQGRELTPASDIYALGIVMYQMLTGKRPFEADTPIATAARRLTEPPPSPRSLVPGLDRRWERVILKCLAREPGQRFATSDELIRSLRGDAVVTSPLTSRQRVALVVFAIAAVALAVTLYGVHRSRLKTSGDAAPSLATARTSVAVLGFKNLSGQPDKAWISTALAEMLGAELSAGGKIRAISGEDVSQVRMNLGISDFDSLGKDTLTRVRNNIGSDFVVIGSYLDLGPQAGNQIRLDVKLQDAAAGQTVASLSETGTEAGLLDLVLRTGADLRQKMGVAGISQTEVAGIQASTSVNPEAIRLYAEGLSELRLFDALQARNLLQQAVNADPNYVLAHSALSAAWQELGYDEQAAKEAKTAFALSGNLSQEERLWVEGQYRRTTHELEKAVQVYSQLFTMFPDNIEYGLRLAHTQRSAGEAKAALATLDKLRRLPAPTRNDARIDLAEAEAAEELSDHKRARAAAARAVQKSDALGAKLLLAAARDIEGEALDSLGEHKQAIADYEASKNLCAEAGDQVCVIGALNNLGGALYRQGDLSHAESIFEQALEVARRTGDERLTAKLLMNIADVAGDEGNISRAKVQLEAALEAFRHIGSKEGVAHALANLGTAMLQLGDYKAAKREWDEALPLARQANDKYGEEAILSGFGDLGYWAGNLEDSKSSYGESLKIAQATADKTGATFNLKGLAEVLLAENDVAGAQQCASQALGLAQETGERTVLAQARISLAEIALAQNQPAQAVDFARAAADEFHAENNRDFEPWAVGLLAESLLHAGKVKEAREAAKTAELLSLKTQDRSIRLYAGIMGARVRAGADNSNEARAALIKRIAEARALGCIPCEYEARLALGEAELAAGRTAAGRARLRALQSDAKQRKFNLVAAAAQAQMPSPLH